MILRWMRGSRSVDAAWGRARARLADSSGVALATALGTMLALSVSVVSMIEFSAASSRHAADQRIRQQAFVLAEAGVNDAASRLAQNPSAFTGAAATEAYPGGTVTTSGSLAGDVWTLTSTASVPSSNAGSGEVRRTVSQDLRVSYAVPMTGNEAYRYVFTNAVTCTLFQNSFTITAPLYVTGDLCLRNTAQYLGSQLMVRGTVETDNTASVGTSSDLVEDVHIGGGCRYTSSEVFLLPPTGCGADDHIWPGSFSSTVPTYSKPAVNLDNAYATAKPGPNYPCTVGSLPVGTVFDNGGGRNGSAPKFQLFASSNYDCQRWEGGQLVGQLKWTNGDPGALVVSGTIFFDGDVEVAQQKNAVYSGTGTIYANKKVVIQNQTTLCAVSGCDTSWDPNDHLLTLVAGSAEVPSFEIQNNTSVQAAVYTVGGFKIQNSAQMQGPIIASAIDVQNSAILKDWTDLTSLPPGVPANGAPTVIVAPVAGSWRG